LKNSGASFDPPEGHACSTRQRCFGRRWSVGLGSGTRSVEGRRLVCLGSRPTGPTDAAERMSGPGPRGPAAAYRPTLNHSGAMRDGRPAVGGGSRRPSRQPPPQPPCQGPPECLRSALPWACRTGNKCHAKFHLQENSRGIFKGTSTAPSALLPQADAERQRTTLTRVAAAARVSRTSKWLMTPAPFHLWLKASGNSIYHLQGEDNGFAKQGCIVRINGCCRYVDGHERRARRPAG
jgi:hypothetical protein